MPNATNASATRVGERRAARTSETSRTRLSPRTRASAERPRRELLLDRGARDERDAVAGEHRAPHRLLEAELERNVEVAQPFAALAQLVLEQLAHAAALLHHDQRLVAQLVERHGASGEGVVRRRREDHLVAEERLERHAALAARRADDPELELARGDVLDDGVRVGDRQRHLHTGVLALELAEEQRQDDRGGPGRRAEVERAGELALADGGDVLEQLILEREHPLRAPVQSSARLGRLDPAPRAVEELLAEPLLERADLQADGRLRDPETLRRL